MILTIDIGNTNIVIGCFLRGELEASFRIKTELGRTGDEYAVIIGALLRQRLPKFNCDAAIVSSVVPLVTPNICYMVEQEFGVKPFQIDIDCKTGVTWNIEVPSSMGADRIVDVVAAKYLYGLPALVIDFGTATTFDYIDADSVYQGGLIAAGLGITLDALVGKTAKLPSIELNSPESIVAKNTVTAMQAGIVTGYECAIDGLIAKTLAEVGEVKHIILTGGLGKVMLDKLSEKYPNACYDPDLTLKGILKVWELNS